MLINFHCQLKKFVCWFFHIFLPPFFAFKSTLPADFNIGDISFELLLVRGETRYWEFLSCLNVLLSFIYEKFLNCTNRFASSAVSFFFQASFECLSKGCQKIRVSQSKAAQAFGLFLMGIFLFFIIIHH